MDWLKLLQIIAIIVAVGVAMGAGLGGFFYALKSKSNKLLKEQVDQMQQNFNSCQKQHSENLKLIHNLEGEINTLKTIPLQVIQAHIESDDVFQDRLLRIMGDTSESLKVLINKGG